MPGLYGLLFTTALTVAVCAFAVITSAASGTERAAMPTPRPNGVPVRIFEYNADCQCEELLASYTVPGG